MSNEPQTIQQHLAELRKRAFFVVLAAGLGGLMTYIFREPLMQVVMSPLKQGDLIYTTPGGGFQFVINLCVLGGLLVCLPTLLYQVLRYLEPTFEHKRLRGRIVFYAFVSTVLAAAGVLFAYLISLPAALEFLNSFSEARLTALITIDSYMRFVVTYILGFAVIFQIPLLLMIIDRIKPLKPSRLLRSVPMVVLISFILGAILTPTPDPINQSLLAGPIILLYLVGVFAIVLSEAKRNRHLRSGVTAPTTDLHYVQSFAKQEVMTYASAPSLTPSHTSKRVVFDVVAPKPVAKQKPAAQAQLFRQGMQQHGIHNRNRQLVGIM